MYGPQAAFFSELFGTKVRYSGVSIGYQLASILAGGLAPIIAVALLKSYGSGYPDRHLRRDLRGDLGGRRRLLPRDQGPRPGHRHQGRVRLS